MKKLSCGVLVFQDDKILMGHSTGNSFWDIPKGLNEVNEKENFTAIRELKEEFGFTIQTNELKDLGVFELNKSKDLHLFKYIGNKTFDVKDAVCTSYFINRYTSKECPEIDGFNFLSIEDAIDKSYKNLSIILQTLFHNDDI